jgi:glycosyltransferase involved in cell wall biosynthesis
VAVTLEQCWHRVPGGTATSILGLLEGLRRHPELELVGVSARHSASPEAPFRPPIPVHQLPLPRPALYEAWHGVGALRWPPVQLATGPVDVVHATALTVPPTRGTPLVLTVHDLAFLADPDDFTKHGTRTFRRALTLTRRHAAVVVVPSQATAAECAAAGIDADRVRVVPWGHESRTATAEDVESVRRRYDLPERYVLFVGTVEPRKNLSRLVGAWRRAAGDGVPLVIAGPAGWGDAAVSGPGILPIGFVTGVDRDALYAGAAAVAYPSLREGFGLPVLEAMAQGAPVLTSKGTATEEVAGDAAVLVDPFDETAIADGLRRLLDDPEAAAALGAKGFARSATYTWDACAAGYADAYRDAAASS